MRRSLVLLCFSAAVLCGAAPAAHAAPLCYRVATSGTAVPHRDTGPTCFAYDYGNECWYGDDGLYPDASVQSTFCYPTVI